MAQPTEKSLNLPTQLYDAKNKRKKFQIYGLKAIQVTNDTSVYYREKDKF